MLTFQTVIAFEKEHQLPWMIAVSKKQAAMARYCRYEMFNAALNEIDKRNLLNYLEGVKTRNNAKYWIKIRQLDLNTILSGLEDCFLSKMEKWQKKFDANSVSQYTQQNDTSLHLSYISQLAPAFAFYRA